LFKSPKLQKLTKEDILLLHKSVCDRFKTTTGVLKQGLLDAVVIRPIQEVYGKETFPTIYLKAASLMESISRWHIFADGNKRTALLVTDHYLSINNYMFLPPLNTVRFLVNVANTSENNNILNSKLIQNIANWLKNYTAEKDNKKSLQIVISNIENELNNLEKLNEDNSEQALTKYNEYMAIDIYPEYKKDINEIKKFLEEIRSRNLRILKESFKWSSGS
jgi:death on curing protein